MTTRQSVLRRLVTTMTHELRGLCATIAAVLVLAPLGAYGQGSALQAALDRREQRLADVDIYVQRIARNEIPGLRLGLAQNAPGENPEGPCLSDCVVYKVDSTVKPDGTPGRMDRPLTGLEVQTLAGLSPGADFLDIYGGALFDAQAYFNSAAGGEGVGMGLGMMMGSDSPWMNPYEMFAAGGLMMQQTAAAMREAEQSLATSAAQAQSEANRNAALAVTFEEIGSEDLDTSPAAGAPSNQGAGPAGNQSTKGYEAELGHRPYGAVENEEVYLDRAKVWVDNDFNVIVAHRLEGTMEADGASRPFFLEVRYSDFREVPGCDLYEPYRRVMRMGGLLDDEQMAQMEEAKRQLAAFEQQMAAMPAAQRAMMEGMMGGQMDTLRSMAGDGALEFAQDTTEYLCNPDLAALFGTGAPVSLGVDLAQIQRNLAALGYEPGNTDGVLDTLTQIAISQFEAEHGMAVTGQPSAQLAAALAAAVAG